MDQTLQYWRVAERSHPTHFQVQCLKHEGMSWGGKYVTAWMPVITKISQPLRFTMSVEPISTKLVHGIHGLLII